LTASALGASRPGYILVRTSMYEEQDMRVSHTPRQLSES
jgi:hypothetical protein